ncbi:cytochrome c oxidase subunit 2 [Virgibacillus halotolerans]|uniref:cytochrome c oxidase subunit II n=1 Tax=Virgibacillus halotolerans TaxID=1071053 RepID=UPI001961B027|nr:cytochrome c oxidase subunit II [Virgibacillus halotolerans]MBM7601167.1 cytochrome c oxidase subunit 2 [Virgibacillus halotolerans]
MKKLSILPIFLFLAGCNITVLDPKSSTGKEQSFLIWFSFGLMTIVVITVFILFAWFVFKYRYTKEKDDVIPKDVKGNLKLELTWTILPVLLLAVLAVPTIAITYDQSPVSDAKEELDGVPIDVKAEQFKWTFTHENGKEVTDELVIPETDAVIFHLKSADIIHSFWVPALAGKVDVFPDKELTYEIKNPEAGTYKGKCAEYCGLQHADMTFDVKVVSAEDYKKYIEEEE